MRTKERTSLRKGGWPGPGEWRNLEESEGKEASKNSQGQSALHSSPFCFLILSLNYRNSFLAQTFYSQCVFSQEASSPWKSLGCHPRKDSSHTHNSSPHCSSSLSPKCLWNNFNLACLFHLQCQYIYSSLNSFPSPPSYLQLSTSTRASSRQSESLPLLLLPQLILFDHNHTVGYRVPGPGVRKMKEDTWALLSGVKCFCQYPCLQCHLIIFSLSELLFTLQCPVRCYFFCDTFSNFFL